MIDEKKMIKKLKNRIDIFVKEYLDKHDSFGVQIIKKFIHMLQIEAKEQAKRKE
jgi:hypothetical protein